MYVHRIPGKSPADELPPHAAVGRQPNRGMEGLDEFNARAELFLPTNDAF